MHHLVNGIGKICPVERLRSMLLEQAQPASEHIATIVWVCASFKPLADRFIARLSPFGFDGESRLA